MSSALIAASSVFMAISTSAAIFSFHFSRTGPMQARYISFFLSLRLYFLFFLDRRRLASLENNSFCKYFLYIHISIFYPLFFRNQLYVIPCFSTNKRTLQRSSRFHIKKDSRIDMLSVHPYFEMQMFGGSPSGTSCQSDRLSRLDRIAYRYQIFRVMTVNSFQSVGMTYHDYLAVSAIMLCHTYYPIEDTANGIVRTSLDIRSAMSSP